jgi:hypothetical protein
VNDYQRKKAVQFDFYFPKAIWKNRHVQRFCKLLTRHGGATVFNDETGVWHGSKEVIQLFRVIIPSEAAKLKKFRKLLQTELDGLVRGLQQSKSHEQETIMFSETSIVQVSTLAQ